MRRFLAILRKEFRQIGRDPLSLGLLLFVPVMLLALYGYALSFDVKHVAVAVLDEDRTAASRELLDSLFQNPYFARHLTLDRLAEADEALDRGRVRVALVIPRGYAERLARGETVRVQALVDSADANTGSTVIGYLEALADRATRKLNGGDKAPGPRIQLEPRVWFNPELVSAKFLVPGLMGMILMLSAVVATSLSIVREKERETLEQMMVSPLRPEELVMGKTLPYVVICLVTTVLILLLAHLLFDVTVTGSYACLAVATLLFLFAALGMGVFISTVTDSQQVAFTVAVIATLLPSLILSGMVFPIQNMPPPVRAVTVIIAPKYFVAALRAIILKGASFSIVWPQLAGLLGLGALFNALAARRVRRSLC